MRTPRRRRLREAGCLDKGSTGEHLLRTPALTAVLAGLGALAALALLPASGSGAAQETTPRIAPLSSVRELSEKRTADSDTFLRSDGRELVKISPTPINYRDSAGQWQPIDTTLKASSGGGLEDSATQLPVSLPASLSAPVTVGSGGESVSFALQGAGGAVAASGSNASYAEALPGVSASYEQGPASLKETLTLASAAAPTTYRYRISTTRGLTAKLIDGAVLFSDSEGHPRYVMAAPSASDSSAGEPLANASVVHYELGDGGTELTMSLDDAWLSSPQRVFPVKIDPSVSSWDDTGDCFIASESYANTSLCGKPLSTGYQSSPASVERSLLWFNLGSTIAQDSVILSAHLSMYLKSDTASSAQTLDAFGLTRQPTASATWNTYDGSHSWTKAGGDYSSSPEGQAVVEKSQVGSFISWGLAPLVEGWVRTPSSNYGMLVRADNESTAAVEEFEGGSGSPPKQPVLEVEYSPQVGAVSDATFTGAALSDRSQLSLNVADGDLLLQNHVLELPGIGYDLSIDQYFNGRNRGAYGSLGSGAGLSTGVDVQLERTKWDGSRIYHDPSGAWWRFDRNPAGDSGGNKAFTTPAGFDATLVERENGTTTLTYNASQLKYEFNSESPTSFLQKIEENNKNATTLHYNSEGISSIVDTHGHTLSFKYSKTTHDITSITDGIGREWAFADNSEKQLTSLTDPDKHKVSYSYAESGSISQITDADGHLIELSYDSTGRLSEIRRVVNGTASTPGTKDVITTFAYSIPVASGVSCPTGSFGDTEVVSPDGSPEGKADSHSSGHQTFYCFNDLDQVTKTIDQAGNATTAEYEAASGSVIEYQNPGDTANEGKVKNTLKYNTSGAVEEIVQGSGATTSLKTHLKYGSEGFAAVEPKSVQTPFSTKTQEKEQHTTFYGYNSSGDVTSVNLGSEKGKPELTFKYEPDGLPTESTDGDGNKTKYEYNTTTKDLTKIVPPSVASAREQLEPTELTYDEIDRIHTIKDGRGITATFTYDGEDRVTKVEYSDGSSVSFEYDANGNVLKRTDAKGFGEPYTGLTQYEYDQLNRPTLETTPSSKTTRYAYDYDSNLTSLEDAGGTVSYEYGPDDVLKSITEPENSSHPFKLAYESGDDNRESVTFPNGILQCYKTDPAGRLTEFWAFKASGEQTCENTKEGKLSPSSTLTDYKLFYTFTVETENEKKEKVNETVDTPELQTLKNLKAATETAYTYDTLDRVVEAVTKPTSGGSATLTSTYKYDNAGNLQEDHTFSPETTYTNEHMFYNADNEICKIATTEPTSCPEKPEEGIAGEPTYDKDGDMTSDGALTGAAKLAYTERDQLSSITPHGGSATQIVSHGTGQADLAAIGSEEVIQNILGVGVTGSGESAKYYTRGSEGTLFAKRTAKGKPSETEYYLLDTTGSPAMLTSSTGTQTAPSSGVYRDDPYGNPVGTGPRTFGYHSGQILPDGLIHFGTRYYDPAVGQWTQEDPAGEGFVYAGDDPVNVTDPAGECLFIVPEDVCKAAEASFNGLRFTLRMGTLVPFGPAARRCAKGALVAVGIDASSKLILAEPFTKFPGAGTVVAGLGCLVGVALH